ncbi:succinylglutamate desuccinylase/aspartoacylase domain-containing protein [Prosthecobacter fluviatilis]|uniref:Succinylglutamate desuccinylase/aspartoacylase family protein n=1 Tax=Prosthecobacter fluviatilis TaxID=445931 RepID=A0ABW0KUB0_9BACT
MTETDQPEQDSFLPKFVSTPLRSGHGMKIGIFAGIHGDEEAGTLATEELIAWAAGKPEELHDYELHFFPVCNPTGCHLGTRHSHSGLDLNREFWCGSIEPEVVFLEAELRRERYDGIISLHSDDTSDGCYGFVSGALLSEHLLEPALQAASEFLPRNEQHIIDGFPALRGIIKEGYLGILSAPPEQRPHALEIVFETPALAPMDAQVKATVAAVKRILAEYRELQAYAANL